MEQKNYSLVDYQSCKHFGTVTLDPEMYKLPIQNQIKKSFSPLFSILKGLSDTFLLTMELTKKGNLHYHFIAEFKDPELDCFMLIDNLKSYNFKNRKCASVFGFSEAEASKNPDDTAIYITKDISKTSKLIGQRAWYDHNYVTTKTLIKKVKNVIKFVEPTEEEKTELRNNKKFNIDLEDI